MDVLTVQGLTRKFGPHVVLDDISFSLPPGQILVLLGPNGSGKTTSIRMIMGILLPDEGRVELLGGRPGPMQNQRVGYLPEERGVYRKMKVIDFLAFLGEIRGLKHGGAVQEAKIWLDRLDLMEWADKKVQDLSKGMRQKVQFVGTILHNPELLILDEPFSGLDTHNTAVLNERIENHLKQDGMLLLTAHHAVDIPEQSLSNLNLESYRGQ